jgi:hypothetical protein
VLRSCRGIGAYAVDGTSTADRRLFDRARKTPQADRLQWLGFVTS